MKSKAFSRCKNYRAAHSIQRDCLYLKQTRSRKDRRKNKVILKCISDVNDVNMYNIIQMSGEREII
jgi:hypothetical protein